MVTSKRCQKGSRSFMEPLLERIVTAGSCQFLDPERGLRIAPGPIAVRRAIEAGRQIYVEPVMQLPVADLVKQHRIIRNA